MSQPHLLFNEEGVVTLSKPIRAVLHDEEGRSARIVAFRGRMLGARDGFGTFLVDTWFPHPDDSPPTQPPMLDGHTVDDEAGTVTVHVELTNVASMVVDD